MEAADPDAVVDLLAAEAQLEQLLAADVAVLLCGNHRDRGVDHGSFPQ
jgi:hypothetical protein